MKKYKKIICMIAAVCLLGTAAFCGFRIYSHYAHESEQEEVFEKIAEVILNQKMQNKENCVMKELAKRFIGEECIIYTITSNDGSVQGLIKEIDDGGMVVEKKTGELEIINLDFVTRIRQYPRKKNGKKKDIVLD